MNFIKKLLPAWGKIFLNQYWRYPLVKRYGKKIQLNAPIWVDPRFVELDDFVRIQPNVTLITCEAKLVVKKYSAIAAGCLIVPGAHIPTVGLPQYLSILHINDVQRDITINEDCWIGAEAALLSKCNIGRGAVVGACSVVTKDIPPYAVVAGVPAKIIATRFSIEQILNHEKELYPENERFSEEYLKMLFETTYSGLKSIGTSEMSNEDRTLLENAKKEWGIYPF